MITNSPPAKIMRPSVTGVVQRDRLFARIDDRIGKPAVWVMAPGGSGKSTLVASYLDDRRLAGIWYRCDAGDAELATFFYYLGLAAAQALPAGNGPLPLLTHEFLGDIPTFTRRFFEAFYAGINHSSQEHPFTIILDDYHEVPVAAPLHETLAAGLDQIPPGVCFVVMSREAPPKALARQHVNGKMEILDFNEVRFTLEESRSLIHARLPQMEPAGIAAIHGRMRGWAAGIVLALEHSRLTDEGLEAGPGLSYAVLFDYFALETFPRVDAKVQEFLLKTSFLPTMTVKSAGLLSGTDDADRILSVLNMRHFFTDRLQGAGQEYQYHPLFREFLLSKTREIYRPDELISLRLMAAELLEQEGKIEDSAEMYCSAGDVAGLARIVKAHARELLLQGRNATLAKWLSCFPDEHLQQDPWLLYWSGLSSFPLDLPRTRALLGQALSTFRVNGDRSGIYLSWAGVVDTHVFSDGWCFLDDCLADVEVLRADYPTFASFEDELVASSRILLCLTLRKTDQAFLIESWLQKVLALLQERPSFEIRMDTVFCMSVYYLWTGDYDRNAVLLERAAEEVLQYRASPFAAIRIKLMTGIQKWVVAEYAVAMQVLAEGLELAERYGIHLYDSLMWSFLAAIEMVNGRQGDAAAALKRQGQALMGAESPLTVFFYQVNSAWYSLLDNRLSRAEEHLRTAYPAMEQMGTPYYRVLWHLGAAQVDFLQGRGEEAHGHLSTARHVSLSMKSQVMEWYCHLLGAWFSLEEGKEAEGLLALHRWLSLGRAKGYVHLEFYQPAVVRRLFARALEENIETGYVQRLIRALRLTPPETEADEEFLAATREGWPYPVKIYTHGRFEVLLDEVPLTFSGKEQAKPLELLKVLIAYGSRRVPRDLVSDVLWPAADGDQANKSFETTLGRLRKLIGGEDRIIYQARQLTLNPLYCWVDTLALDSLFKVSQKASPEQLRRLCDKAIDLHKGPFLSVSQNAVWVMERRENQVKRLCRVIEAVGRHYERAGEWELAADYYSRGIDADDLAEPFYRGLMTCQRRLGNDAAAVRTYSRCSDKLRDDLGVAPSSETTALYKAIIHKSG